MLFLEIESMDIIWSLLKISPIVGLEGLAIWWLVRELKEKDKAIKDKETQISELYEYIRENDKDNLIVLNNVNSTLDKVIENQKALNDKVLDGQKRTHEELLRELSNLKEFIDLKITQTKK